MKAAKLSIRFVICKAKMNSSGLSTLQCRLTLHGYRKTFSTGVQVEPKYWDSKKQCVHKNCPNSQESNLRLDLLRSNISKEYLKLIIGEKEVTLDELYQAYKGEPLSRQIGVIQNFRNYLKAQEKLIGIDLKNSTWKKFEYVCEQASEFIRSKYRKKDIPLKRLKLQFLVDFEYYLKTVRGQKQVTINKSLQRFRKPVRIAVVEGLINKDPFAGHKPGRVIKEVIFLSVDELELLETYKFRQQRLSVIRDLFVFCCYTGLPYEEMSNLKKVHIVKGFDDKQWIHIKRGKTTKPLSIPLLPKAREILDHYNGESDHVLPKYSNQKINSYLKEIAHILGINKRITHHTARKTFASTVLLYNNVPMEIVSELLGHSSLNITQEYYGKIVSKRISEEMIKLGENYKSFKNK